MQIRLGYDIAVSVTSPTAMVLMLHVRPELRKHLLKPDELVLDPETPVKEYTDGFGNRCVRLVAPPGRLNLRTDALIEVDGLPDVVAEDAIQHPIEDLPSETLEFLLGSRYCEVDQLSNFAWETFGDTPLGWARVQAVTDWVHNHVVFGYQFARSTKTACDVLQEKTGVCRDFQHLAVTLCRCLGIPARYATGYLGEIGLPPGDAPMDFSAWFQVYLGDRWYDFDARHNKPRIGRTLMAVGRDAADVALITSFGPHTLEKFEVVTEEVAEAVPAEA
jgi:Transglutaminase-like enzymes, putative cysteine proteases